MTTNFEKIKNMTVEEMAEYFHEVFDENKEHFGCLSCINYNTHHHNYTECKNCEYWNCGGDIKQWLQLESEE